MRPDELHRLGHQVSPEAVQVLPDVPASAAHGAASTGPLVTPVAAGAQGVADSSSPAAGATVVPATLVLPATSAAAALECAETRRWRTPSSTP